MDPGLRCHGIKDNLTGNLWFKYECLLVSSCKNLDLFSKNISESPMCSCGSIENTLFLSLHLYQRQRTILLNSVANYCTPTLHVLLHCYSSMPVNTNENIFKGTPITKALTCMKIYLYKQKWQFCRGDVYFWLFRCLSNFCISHRLIYIQTYSFLVLSSMLISHFLVTSWFDSICITVA